MSLIKRYDSIIHMIEICIVEQKKDITQCLSSMLGVNEQFIEDAFLFISNKTLSKYINERLLVNIYYEWKGRNESLESIAAKYDKDASSLSRAIKRMFGKSPKNLTQEEVAKFRPLTFLELMKRDEHNDKKDSIQDNEIVDYQSMIQGLEINEEKRLLYHISMILKLSNEEVRHAQFLSKWKKINIYQACCYVRDLKESFFEKISESLSLEQTIDHYLSNDEKEAVFLLSVRHSMSPDLALSEFRRMKKEGIDNILNKGEDFMEILSYASFYGIRMSGDEIQHIVDILYEKKIVIPLAFNMIEKMKIENISFDEVVCKEEFKKYYGTALEFDEEYDDYDEFETYKDPYDEFLKSQFEEPDIDDTSYWDFGQYHLEYDMEEIDDYLEKMFLYSDYGDEIE